MVFILIGLFAYNHLEPCSNYFFLLCEQCGLFRKTEKNEIHEDGTFELSWQMDLEEETFEMIQVQIGIRIFFQKISAIIALPRTFDVVII